MITLNYYAKTIIIITIFIYICNAEDKTVNHNMHIITSSNCPFPHPDRMEGKFYNNIHYNFEEHYNDSSVAIYIPDNFSPNDSIDIVVYFHGWWNNIRKSIENFELIKQFSDCNKNAISIFPEGPRNAPDSFGGKLEEKDRFKLLIDDIMNYLISQGKIPANNPGKIILAGHSGAYRVISFILDRGGLTDNISEVFLFDALYGEFDKFSNWLDKYNGRLINIVTPDGGTYQNSLDFLNNLNILKIPYYKHNNNNILLEELNKEKVTFIFTSLGHSEVINPYFNLLLKTSSLSDINTLNNY